MVVLLPFAPTAHSTVLHSISERKEVHCAVLRLLGTFYCLRLVQVALLSLTPGGQPAAFEDRFVAFHS